MTQAQGAAPDLATLRQTACRLHGDGKQPEALDAYQRYLNRRPEDAGIWSNLGALLRAMAQHRDAARAHARAHALDPDLSGVRNNYANVLSDIGRYDEAIALRHAILEADPSDLNQRALIGRALRGQGRYGDAIAYLEHAAAQHPQEAEFRLQLAFARLGAGDYMAGFESYRARWDTDEIKQIDLPFPRWDGADLAGKTVLVMPEQGFGDAVLVLRFLPLLRARAATIFCLTEKPMTRLFDGLEGADWTGPSLAKDAPIDVYLTLMDLPRLGLTDRGDIPPPTKLNVPEESVARAQAIVAPFPEAFRIGVVWSGSTTYKGNAFRSFSHRDFLPLTEIADVQLFSLYKGPHLDAFRQDGSAAFIVDASGSDRDFADCAALMQEMDLIITSDTAAAHIAGSLGLPTWTVLHWDPFWVYTHTGETTPWYPSMRLFRQDAPLDWDSAFVKVGKALQETVEDWRRKAA